MEHMIIIFFTKDKNALNGASILLLSEETALYFLL